MSVPFFIARRYLRPQRFSFITIISLCSVLGIVIGTAALIIVMSLFNGFRNMARDMLVGFGPHVRIEQVASASSDNAAQADDGTKVDSALVQRVIETAPGAMVVPVYASKLVVECKGVTNAVQGIGLEQKDVERLDGLRRSVIMGTFMTNLYDGIPSVVLAGGVAEKMQLLIGDTVVLYAPEMIEQALTTAMIPGGRRAVVRGIFQSNTSRDVDYTYAYLDANLMRSLTRRANAAYYDVYLQDATRAQDVAESLQHSLVQNAQGQQSLGLGSLREGAVVRSWEQLNKSITDTMKLERIGAFIVLALIVVVAAFNVLVSLTLTVVEKRRDIAILRTIGFTAHEIGRLYLLQGLLIGVVSVSLGVLLGMGLSYGQIFFGWVRFDQSDGFLVSQLPMEVQAWDVVLTAIVGLVLASLAAIYPSRRAASLVVAEALRTE